MNIKQFKIHRVRPKQLEKVIDLHVPCGIFLAKEGRKWVAVDNSTFDAWTEEFSHKRKAIRWLRGKFEVGGKAKQRARIREARELVEVALKQGVVLNTEEADVILGYLEGHGYCLMADDKGTTVRHDEQYGDNHRGDEPYTVQEIIEFCQEMNEDLLGDDCFQDVERLTRLRKDEQIIDALMEQTAAPISEE